jgi:hypothetical protein
MPAAVRAGDAGWSGSSSVAPPRRPAPLPNRTGVLSRFLGSGSCMSLLLQTRVRPLRSGTARKEAGGRRRAAGGRGPARPGARPAPLVPGQQGRGHRYLTSSAARRKTACHELGHALGFGHRRTGGPACATASPPCTGTWTPPTTPTSARCTAAPDPAVTILGPAAVPTVRRDRPPGTPRKEPCMRRPLLLLTAIVSTAAALGSLALGARRLPHRRGLTSRWT